MAIALGIDFGGTKIAAALVRKDGRVTDMIKIPTLKNRQVNACFVNLLAEIDQMLSRNHLTAKKLKGIGVGLPGPVNPASGKIPWSPNMQGWAGFELRKKLRARYKLPVFMDNDANAAAVGEMLFGAGKKYRDLIYITVSTGVGGGIIIDRKLVHGSAFSGGEVGHMAIVPGGNLCGCGKKGCLEAYASGTAIAKAVREAIKKDNPRTLMRQWPLAEISAKKTARAAVQGDALAKKIFIQAAEHLGIGIANLMMSVNPQAVIVGGSVSNKAPGFYFPAVLRAVRAYTWPEVYKSCRVIKTALPDHVGNLGAASLVFQ